MTPSSAEIEVEKKYILEPHHYEALCDKATKIIAKQELRDIYYDNGNYELTLNDWWLRKRNGAWELKIPIKREGCYKFGIG